MLQGFPKKLEYILAKIPIDDNSESSGLQFQSPVIKALYKNFFISAFYGVKKYYDELATLL